MSKRDREAGMTPTQAVDEAITSRRSVRGFRPDPVPEATIRDDGVFDPGEADDTTGTVRAFH